VGTPLSRVLVVFLGFGMVDFLLWCGGNKRRRPRRRD
jgi:hypothetical protein